MGGQLFSVGTAANTDSLSHHKKNDVGNFIGRIYPTQPLPQNEQDAAQDQFKAEYSWFKFHSFHYFRLVSISRLKSLVYPTSNP